MIILRNIHLENFMCIDSLDLSFNENTIVSISGKNGSGKSALIYAIALCITGYRYGESYRDYVKSGEDTAKVILDAELKGEPIHYELFIKGSNKTGNPLKKEVTYKGITYLNSDYSNFMKDNDLDYIESLMFLFQGNNELITSKPSERAATLRKLFQFEFTNIVDSFKEKVEQDRIKTIEDEAILNELKKRTFNESMLMRESTPFQLKEWEDRISQIDKDLFKLSGISFNDYSNEIKEAEKILNNTKEWIENSKKEKESLEKKIKENNKFIEENSSLNLEELKEEIKEYQNKVSNINTEVKILEKEIDSLTNQISIGKTGICHACGQPVDENHVVILQDKLNQLNIDLDIKKEERSQIVSTFNNLSNEYNKLERIKKEYDKKILEIQRMEESLRAIDYRYPNEEFLMKKQTGILEDLYMKKKESEKFQELLNNKDSLEEERKLLNEKLTRAKEIITVNKEKKSQNEKIRKDREENNKRIQDVSIDINNLNARMNISKQCQNIFESQFPNYILLRACGQLESYINSITNEAFEGFRVKLNQSRGGVSFFYKTGDIKDDEDWLPVCLASGAQKTILSLAYIIALGKMYGINCLLLDEVDSACSPETAKTIYKFIASLEGFNQIIFISHNEESREAMRESNRDNIVFYRVSNGSYEIISEN